MKNTSTSARAERDKLSYFSAEPMLVDVSILVVPVWRSGETALEVLLDDEIDLIRKQIKLAMDVGTLSGPTHLSQDHDLVPRQVELLDRFSEYLLAAPIRISTACQCQEEQRRPFATHMLAVSNALMP